jgi:hypothetical protein
MKVEKFEKAFPLERLESVIRTRRWVAEYYSYMTIDRITGLQCAPIDSSPLNRNLIDLFETTMRLRRDLNRRPTMAAGSRLYNSSIRNVWWCITSKSASFQLTRSNQF